MQSYRDILKQEFASRAQRNPRYSLRAFARDLNFLPSRLSDIFNGKQGLSRTSASVLAERLGYSPRQKNYFCQLVESEHARSQARRETAREEIKKLDEPESYQTIQEAAFRAIADWYHFAILELFSVEGFIQDKHWMARRLGITPIEVDLALDRLKRLGLVVKKGGRLEVAVQFPASLSEVPSDAIKKHHTQILEKATRALYEQEVSKRDFSTITVAVDPDLLPSLKEEIKAFRRGIEQKMKKTKKGKKAVYCMAIQLFGLDNGRRGASDA